MSKWEKVRLGDLTKIKTGKLDANASSNDGEYPFFTCSKEPLKISSYSYDCECVLVAGNGDLNVKYYNGKFDAYQRTYIIESIDKNKLFVPYLYLYLSDYVDTLRGLSIGGVIKYIKLGNLTDAAIPIPPLNTQKQIVAILDKANLLIESRKQQLAQLDLLVKSRFVEMFGDPVTNPMGWDVKKLKNLYKVRSSKRIYQNEQVSEGIRFLRVSDLVRKILDGIDSCDLYISEEQYMRFLDSGLVPKAEDILVTSRGTLGLCYIVQPSDRFYFQDGMISWLEKQGIEIESIYVYYLFGTYGFRQQMEQLPTGTTVSYLSLETLGNLEIMVPPLPIQNAFAAFVHQVDKSKFEIQKGLKQMEIQYNALMQQYFG
ncbi:type I restriction-modification system S subunit [Treponema primitia ZAS-2]|uniref:Type I restriction-modification system S subunit n=1 Tax=Treponema primitia (strain ATCC BAA-887 / DSM 12427 / ZAS-2) TaxID=545694 RepID=F5YIS4_TREPZ|nr:restriction endonuclease subunit S [Treponema primitia]AEF86822.1 type I restriction-modification system S subunit [Treponema primitia ZAS-2]